MSRSYRKPWIKDPANRYMKRVHAQAYRSRCKQIMKVWTKHWIDPMLEAMVYEFDFRLEFFDKDSYQGYDDPVFPSKHEINNQYDIYDFNFCIYKESFGYLTSGGCMYARGMTDNMDAYRKACRK